MVTYTYMYIYVYTCVCLSNLFLIWYSQMHNHTYLLKYVLEMLKISWRNYRHFQVPLQSMNTQCMYIYMYNHVRVESCLFKDISGILAYECSKIL